jgi:hypothetical protein
MRVIISLPLGIIPMNKGLLDTTTVSLGHKMVNVVAFE